MNYKMLLKEFDYDKNTLDDTIGFLKIMLNEIEAIKKEIKYGKYKI